MQPMRISIVLPFPVTKPVGGAKVMYEYANRLSGLGHTVSIFHSINRPFKKSSTPVWFKQILFRLRGVERPGWFPLKPGIKSVIVPAITNKHMPDADIVMCTWWQMTYAISELQESKGKKFNLIQDYETWAGMEDKVKASYSLPVNQIVIAAYLQQIVKEAAGVHALHIPNAVDEKKYFVSTPIASRDPQSVIMLYSREPRKGTAYGLEALEQLHKNYPGLKLILFGVYPAPADLAHWIKYYQKPNDLAALYNSAAVFCSPSLGEGWALPPAEAMACGCAVVCTNIGGHRDYARDNDTALLVAPESITALVKKIGYLFENELERRRIAANALRVMSTEFNWDASAKKLEEAFAHSLKN